MSATLDPGDLYEVFVQWRAYQELHELLGGEPRTADPRDLIGKVAAYGRERAAAALADAYVAAGDLDDAEHVLAELLEMAAHGRRPRYGRELGPDFCAQFISRRAYAFLATKGATP